MRRHLRIPSNVSLRGRGAGRTMLSLAPISEADVVSVERFDEESLVTVKDAAQLAGVQVGDGVSFDTGWGYSLFSDLLGSPAQQIAVREAQGSGKNVIRFNLAGDVLQPNRANREPAIDVEASDSIVSDNLP